jgi:hypothetical protein
MTISPGISSGLPAYRPLPALGVPEALSLLRHRDGQEPPAHGTAARGERRGWRLAIPERGGVPDDPAAWSKFSLPA